MSAEYFVKRVMMAGTAMNGKGGVATVVRGYVDSGIMERLNIDYFPTHSDGSRLFKFIFYALNYPMILFHLKRYRIIHIHTASRWSYRRKSFIICIAKLLGKKVVIHLHGAEFDKYFEGASGLEKAWIRHGFALADRVIALSDQWRKKVLPFCREDKVTVIPNGIPLIAIRNEDLANKCGDPRIILFLGELGARKGVYDLIDAVKCLDMEPDRVQVFLCGNGEIDKVKSYVMEKGLARVINVPGWITGQEKEALIRKASLFILPSYHEGLPVAILEAMASGTPVISTPVGGIPYAVEDGYNGFIVPTHSPALLAERMRTLLVDAELWTQCSLHARETVREKFSMETLEANLRSLYSDLWQG